MVNVRNVNAVVCLTCYTFIESKYRHDFKTCTCLDASTQVSVDGGKDYAKRAYGPDAKYLEVFKVSE